MRLTTGHIVLNVGDVDITTARYQRALGMEREDLGPSSRTSLKLGGQKINLRPHDRDACAWRTGATREVDAGDVCFIIAVPPDEAVAHLHDRGVAIPREPIDRVRALRTIESAYCRDPDGNMVETAFYQSH